VRVQNTTFCGDWSASVWNSAGWAGQSQSCAATTGYKTCEDYVLNEGDKFDQAYWEVRSHPALAYASLCYRPIDDKLLN
jgi:hypothetical protein